MVAAPSVAAETTELTAAAGPGTAEQHANGSGGEGLVLSSSPPASEGPAECVVHRIVPEALGVVWSTVKPMIRKSVKWSPITSRLETINDVEAKVYDGTYQLWVIFRGGDVLASVLTCINEHSRCKVLDIVYGAGDDLDDWIEELYATLDDEAVEQDCRYMRVEGRPGWEKPLDDLGFEVTHSTFMREV